MLKLKSLQAGYGRLPVLKGISLHVREGEVVTLIGGNGAGKSTTLRTISGLLRARKGAIEFAGHDLTRMAAEQIVTLGLALVPEGRRVFKTLSVTANLELGAYHRCGSRARCAGTWRTCGSASPSFRPGPTRRPGP